MIRKNKSLLIIGLGVLTLVIIYLISNNMKCKRFSDFIGNNEQKISKVEMVNGSNGKTVVSTDKAKIQELITLLNNERYKKSSDQHEIVGYNFGLTFYADNKKVLQITSIGDRANVNGVYYNVTTGKLDKLGKWYKSLL